jgi:hypothetical protein
MKKIKLVAATITSVLLIGCGSGSESSDTSHSNESSATLPTQREIETSYGDVQYDLSQSFKDYHQAVAKLNVSNDINGAVYNDRQKLLIDADGNQLNFVMHAEPADLNSSCVLPVITPTLDNDLDNLELTRIGIRKLYLMRIKGFPSLFNEQTCQFKEGDNNKEETVLVNENGDVKILNFTIHSTIPYSEHTRTHDARTFAVTTEGDVYGFDLDRETSQITIDKIASTDNLNWYYHAFELLATRAQDGFRFNIYDLGSKKNYDFISNVQIKEQGVGYTGQLYFSTWDDKYYKLEVDRNAESVIPTLVTRSSLLIDPRPAVYQLHPECKFSNQNVDHGTIYKSKDESLFNNVPQELKSQEIRDAHGKTNFLACRSYNGRYLAALNVQNGDYGVYDFGMKQLHHSPNPQLIAGDIYTKAGDDNYTTARQRLFKLDQAGNQVIDLTRFYDLPNNKWISGITPLDL